jgi:hypothetical protein
MAIASYSDLLLAVQDWLFGRTDLEARSPDFIAFAEAKFNRTMKCRQMEARATTAVDMTSATPQYLSLPADFQIMRRIRLLGMPGQSRLSFATGQQIDDMRDNTDDRAATPTHFTLLGTELELFPTPAAAVSFEMIYRRNMPALNTTPSGGTLIITNWLLALAPDAYLHGALMEAAPYLAEDERIPVWQGKLETTVQELNQLSQDALYNAGPLTIRRAGRY